MEIADKWGLRNRSMPPTMLASVKNLLAREGVNLPDETVQQHFLPLLECAEAQTICAACTGRETCPQIPPGFRPWFQVENGEPHFLMEHCIKDLAYARARRQERLMQSSRIPANLRQKTFDNFTPTPSNKAALAAARAAAEGDNGLILAGDTGTGKSHLAAAIMNRRLERGKEAIFVTVPELLADIRRLVKADQETSELLELVKTADLLIMDDMGAEKVTEWVVEQLFVVVNARLNGQKQTVVTTNYQPAELIDRIGGIGGQRIVSRLREMGDWVKIAGKDWRLK
jgi:DNA replication protein DnaC